MVRSYTYACPECRNAVDREYRVPSVIRTCENGCGFDHYVREDLLAKVSEVPEADRPDDWDDRSASEQLLVALREDVVDLPDLR